MKQILSVSEINRYIKEIISRDFILSNVWVKGEISNYKYHYSGHMYFTLKDEQSVIKTVMFKSYASTLKFLPENGMKVILRGNISVFERDGQYQLYGEEMQPDGMGNLHLAYEQLKKKLEAEGLFDVKSKKKLPMIPEAVCVVTSSTGAVIRDIIHVLNRRYSNLQIKLFPVAVQGENAPRQISHAIRKINEKKSGDVIIVARGGGSLEELWAFNEEVVARSIYASHIPVISAVGHETDYTIADFVADLRAPTPSAAAEIVVPEKRVLKEQVKNMEARLVRALHNRVEGSRNRLKRLSENRVFMEPLDRVYQERMRLLQLDKYLHRAIEENIHRKKACFQGIIGKLEALSPLSILSRGYSIVKHQESGQLVRSVTQLAGKDELVIDVSDGQIYCKVGDVKEKTEFKLDSRGERI